MKTIFSTTIFLISIASFAQSIRKTETPIQIVNRNFKEYISTDDNSPSRDERDEMKNAFISLQRSCSSKDLPLLINVWMYYDPTDFPTRDLIEPIFIKHKTSSLLAINNRLKHKRKWEDKETAPYSDLINLKAQLSK